MSKVFILFLFFLSINLQAQTFTFAKTENKKAKNPILVFVHGGAWVSGRAEDYKDLINSFAKNGVCAAAIDYRLAPKFQFPAPIEDLDTALNALIKDNAKSNCDINRIFLMGHSAGAHSIAMWNLKFKLKNVRGFIGLSGIYDIPLLIKTWPQYEDQFITLEFGASSKWQDESPAYAMFENKANWILVTSKKDELVDTAQTELFKRHLEELSIKVNLITLDKESHFGTVAASADPKSELFKTILAFVNQK